MAQNIYKRSARPKGFSRQDTGDGGTRAIREQAQTTLNALKLQQQRSSEYASQQIQSLQGVQRSEEKNRQIIQRLEEDVYRNAREKIRERGQQEYNKFMGEAKKHEKDAKFWMDFAPTLGKNLGKIAEGSIKIADWEMAKAQSEEWELKIQERPDIFTKLSEIAAGMVNHPAVNTDGLDTHTDVSDIIHGITTSNSYNFGKLQLDKFNNNFEAYIGPLEDQIPELNLSDSIEDDSRLLEFGAAGGRLLSEAFGIDPDSEAGRALRAKVQGHFRELVIKRRRGIDYDDSLKNTSDLITLLKDQTNPENISGYVQKIYASHRTRPVLKNGELEAATGRGQEAVISMVEEFAQHTTDIDTITGWLTQSCIEGTSGDSCVSYADKYANIDLLGQAKSIVSERVTQLERENQNIEKGKRLESLNTLSNSITEFISKEDSPPLSYKTIVRIAKETGIESDQINQVIGEWMNKPGNGFTYDPESTISLQTQFNIQTALNAGDMNYVISQFALLPASEKPKFSSVFNFARFAVDNNITQKSIEKPTQALVRRLLKSTSVDQTLHESAGPAIIAITEEVWRELERLQRENPNTGAKELTLQALNTVFSKVEEGKGIWEITPASEAGGNQSVFPYFDTGNLDELQVAQEGHTYVGDKFWTDPAYEYQQQGLSGAKTYDEFKGILTNNNLSLLNRREVHTLIRDINDGVLNLKVPEAFVDIAERYGVPKHQVISDHLKQLGYDVYVPPTPEDQARQVTGTGYGGKVTFRDMTLNSLYQNLSPEQAFNFGTNINAFNTLEGASWSLQETDPELWELLTTNSGALPPEAFKTPEGLKKAWNSGWVRAEVNPETNRIEIFRR